MQGNRCRPARLLSTLDIQTTARHNIGMRKRSSKKPEDVASAEPTALTALEVEQTDGSGKNPAAVALGRLGGKKGGPARAAKLSKKRRSEIAKKAAAARWKKKRPK